MCLPKPVLQSALTTVIFKFHVNQLVMVHFQRGTHGQRLVHSIPSTCRHQAAHRNNSLDESLSGWNRHQILGN